MLVRFQNQGLLFLFLLLSLNSISQDYSFDQLWLSGEPPLTFKKMVKKSGMQHYYVIPGKRGAENLVLWIREGEDFQNSVFRFDSLHPNEQLKSFSPENENDIHNFGRVRAMGYAITYPFKTEGYHNFFLTSKNVKGDTLFIHTAKAERLSHKCRAGHKREVSRIKDVLQEEIPFQLARERIDFENFHLMLQSGKDLGFSVMKYGKAIPDAVVEIVSQKGWKKEMVTDTDGKVKFQIISDHFSPLQDLKKKHISRMLLKANLIESKKGEYEGHDFNFIAYSTTMELDYIPSVHLYKSKTWSVYIVMLSIVLLSVFVFFIFRKRKQKWQKLIEDE